MASTSPINSNSFDEFNTQVQAAALKATKSAVQIPSDVAWHRSMDSEFAKDLDEFSARVLTITNKLLTLVSTGDPHGRSTRLESKDDVLDGFESLVVDSVDQLLERADICLDDFLGRTKAPAIAINPPVGPVTRKSQKFNAPRGHLDPALQHASHLRKPQLSFKTKPDNDNNTSWYPGLTHKYHAQVPLGFNYHDSDASGPSDSTVTVSPHPYRYEIKHISYPARMFTPTSSTPVKPASFAATPFTWVSTPATLQNMLSKLLKAPEIAVDLEYHNYRSYAGFVCLMQISTREEDWIVDTLELREELNSLGEVFADPGIVKVFHGAESDIVWLQQNFDLYVVNLFDTFHASKILDFPRHGLANLLEMYCDFTADKRYQLADWRIRPLPEEMLQYARSDTHFLLYIYDNLRNALLDRARSINPETSSSSSTNPNVNTLVLIKEVLSRSEETALRTYEKEHYDAEGGGGSAGWDTLAKKWNKGGLMAGAGGLGIQREIYKNVHWWRDRVAREDDESTRYVLPNHYIFQIAERPPADMAALIGIFQSVPPVIRRRAKELFDVIKDCMTKYDAQTKIDTVVEVMPSANVEEHIEDGKSVDAIPLSANAGATGLWSKSTQTGNAVASSSSLFGSTLPSQINVASYTTTQSSLFGNLNRPTISSTKPNSGFHELVSRIHSTLVISPSALKVIPTAPQEIEVNDNSTSEAAPGMQVEIPYVAASQRKKAEVVEDSIVVVGQARQKKRKRPKISKDNREQSETTGAAAEGSIEGSASKKSRNGKSHENSGEDVQEPFDFSAVPNILDNNPDSEETKRRRQRKQKKGAFEYGNFPAPPKAHSELKSGNQSHTFK